MVNSPRTIQRFYLYVSDSQNFPITFLRDLSDKLFKVTMNIFIDGDFLNILWDGISTLRKELMYMWEWN